jgi:RNase adaptor protein for sRNA GlmZ degradation
VLPNPGRESRLANQSGLDNEVREFLEGSSETAEFLAHAIGMVERTAHAYEARGFAHLQVCFGCTGGQHRSVFCAEQAVRALRELGFHATVTHTECEAWQ